MVLCPVAIAVGCKKCPIFSVCPVKGVIGDYKVDGDSTQPLPEAGRRPAKKKAKKK